MRIDEAGESALVAGLDAVIDPAVNAQAIGIAAAVRARRIPGVRDVVSTFRSVAVSFDPLVADPAAVRAALREAAAAPTPSSSGRLVEVPVVYGGQAGPDLEDVAAFAGCSAAEAIERHASRPYRVYMLGFLPGYPYMGLVDETLAAPRRAVPRLRVPAGSVGIAGRQTGIYPCDSPGGWQIIGRTDLRLFDPGARRPARFAPGDEVRFVPVANASPGDRAPAAPAPGRVDGLRSAGERVVTVLTPGLLTTVQDEGRWGYQDMGVPVAGAMDAFAHRLANLLVGNPRHAATLEATVVGPELRFEHDAWVAVSGADLQPAVDGRAAPMDCPVRCRAGSVLRFGGRRSGVRACIAVDGGFAVPAVLGSRATHVRSGLGGINGRALRAADRLPLGTAQAEVRDRGEAANLPVRSGGGARLRILVGPHADQCPASAFDALQRARFTVSPQSDRMGYRLAGARLAAPPGEMISDAVVAGAVQVPPSGEPILLMADRQTTGGYAQLAVVITADLPRAAQLAPGEWVEFEACTVADAVAALRAQEEQLGALG